MIRFALGEKCGAGRIPPKGFSGAGQARGGRIAVQERGEGDPSQPEAELPEEVAPAHAEVDVMAVHGRLIRNVRESGVRRARQDSFARIKR